MKDTQPTAEARLEALEAAFATERTAATARLAVAERRVRSASILAGIAVVASLVTITTRQSAAQGYGITFAQLLNRVIALETKTASMSVLTDPNTNQPTVRFEGVNVQIVSGSGFTFGTVNGTGNLIVGYNEKRGDGSANRIGSHNLIVGEGNDYTQYGGLVAGANNTISERFASVTGGDQNVASGFLSTVSGGESNTASGFNASVSGGTFNIADGVLSSVSGGATNHAAGRQTSISGGQDNTAQGDGASVSGGFRNLAGGNESNVSGGSDNAASGFLSSVSGGSSRSVTGILDWRAGGLFQDN